MKNLNKGTKNILRVRKKLKYEILKRHVKTFLGTKKVKLLKISNFIP
jgi:hypothetical protein